MNRRVAGIIVLVVAFVVALYFGFKDNKVKEENLASIKVAYQDEGYPIKIIEFAEKKGYFKQNGIKIEGVPNSKNVSAALTSGEVDVATNYVGTSLLNYLNDQDFVWINKSTEFPVEFSVISRHKKEDVSKSTKAAVNRLGGIQELITTVTAPGIGIKTDLDYSIAPTEASKFAMLDNGTIDIATINIFGEAWKNAESKSYTIFEQKDIFKDVKFAEGIFTTSKKIEADKDKLRSFVKGFNEGQKYAVSHKEELINFLKEKYKMDNEQALRFYESLNAANPKSNTPKLEDLDDVLEPIKKTLKPSKPNKDLKGFIDISI